MTSATEAYSELYVVFFIVEDWPFSSVPVCYSLSQVNEMFLLVVHPNLLWFIETCIFLWFYLQNNRPGFLYKALENSL